MRFVIAFFLMFSIHHHELVDEPTGPLSVQTPAAVHRLYERSQQHGYRYEAITFWQGDGIKPYIGSFNHLWCDDYPFWSFDKSHYGLIEWRDTVQRCVRITKRYHLPPPMLVMQDFGRLDGGNSVYWRCPTRWERWKMIQIARTAGVAGVLLWRPTDKRYWCS